MSKITLLLFWVTLVISLCGAIAEVINPLKDPNICGLPVCELENEKFRYKQNVVYKYSYESSFHTLFDGTDNNDRESQLFIIALLELKFQTKCQGQLKVSSVQLKNLNGTYVAPIAQKVSDYEYDDDESKEDLVDNDMTSSQSNNVIHPRSNAFSKDIEQIKIRFDFRDGLIYEICPDNDEQTWITNFKRGILSALQNSMFRFDLDHKSTEVDVSGKCEVSYKFLGSSGTSIVILKTKDIASCQDRNKFRSIVQITPYEFRRKDISWWPIYNSTSFCNISIDNYIYNVIECSESHVLIPLSNEGSGAVTKNYMKMMLLSEGSVDNGNVVEGLIGARKTLLYDHSFSPKPTHNEIKISRDYLKQMCQLGFPNIQREFPDRFVKFLAASRQLSTKGLQQLLARAGSICSNGRKHVLESLPYIGSAASVEVMKDLITKSVKSKEINPEMEEIWMTSMFYLSRPQESVITTMFSLIQHCQSNRNPMFVLIPTSVVNSFCTYNGDCRENTPVMNIVRYLEENALKSLTGDLNDRNVYEDLIVALKGIGNIGIASKNFEEILKDLIINETKSDDLKLQAIEVFRKMNCERSRDYFMDIYQNFTQSVEIRIASYQQTMKCPTYLTVKQVRKFLKTEKVNQVGSYVWSHLTNIAKTASPQKVELQGLLADEKIDDKFKLDVRKFSKNHEYSLFFDEYNFGFSGESNVIFGIESYLPRSVSFNGTINLFGASVNPFEFNIRMQGLENYVESIFGLDGPLNFDRMLDRFGFIYGYIKNFFNFENDVFIESFLRSKRSLKAKNKPQMIEGFQYKQKYEFNKPNGYFEHKIFGNDIMFYHFNDFNELSDILKKIIPLEQIRNIFSNKEEIFIKSGTMVDVSYSIPLSNGFPLVLSAFGAYSLDLRYYGAMKDENIWRAKSLDFNGKLKPSLSMELSTKMQVDLFYATTDIRLKTNVYSNYAIETDFKINTTNFMSLNVKLPQDRNDIFSIRSQLIGNVEGEDVIFEGINDRYVNSTCTWPTINGAIGLKVCIDYSLPDVSDGNKTFPSLVLSGPIVFDIHLDKADLSAKIFNFEYQWNKGEKSSLGSFVFETPDSKIPRIFNATLLTDPENYNLTMSFTNGDNKQIAIGFMRNSPEEKLADFSIHVNDKKYFSLEIRTLKRFITKTRSLINLKFLLTINDQKVAGIMGTVKILDKNNVTQHDIDLKFETKKMLSTAFGQVIKTENSLTTKMQYSYKFSGKKEETIEIDTELANRSQRLRERTEYNGLVRFNSSAYENYNFATKLSFISFMGHVETKVDINNAPDLIDPSYTFSTKFSFAKNQEENKDSRSTALLELIRPKSMTDIKFYIRYDEHFKNGTEHNVFTLLRYSTNKEVTATASVLIPKGTLFGVDATFKLSVPDMNSCSAAVKVKERIRKDYYIDISAEWFNGENIKAIGAYQDRTSSAKRYHKLKALISSKLFEDINFLLKYSRDLVELKLKLHTEYKSKTYGFLLESSEINPIESIFNTELNWADHFYSLKSNSSSDYSARINRTIVEIHLDRVRDMYLEVWGASKTLSKNFGIEFKWDANRDPSQHIILSYDFNQPKDYVYIGNVLIGYPDRTLNGRVEISNVGPFNGNMRLSWSADEVIDLGYSIGSETSDAKTFWSTVKIDTPFTGWKHNKMNGSIYQKNNFLALNFGTFWADNQNILIDFHVNYNLGDHELSGELKTAIQSSIKDIPIVAAFLKHNQTSNLIDTQISFMHRHFMSDEPRNFSVISLWKHGRDQHHRNISGSVKFLSPFEKFNSGALVTKFSISKEKQLYGVIDADIDSRPYSFAIEGYMKRILDNMMTFNITTPLEAFPYLHGKIGINENRRYLIADLQTSNKSLGVELLFDFVSITDFDLKFYTATPLPAFEKFVAIGKIKEDTIHLEGAWNKIKLGFKGIWHFVSYRDFEYTYQIFTPLTNFEENGIIVRFFAQGVQNFDIEGSFKLGKYKLGLKGFGEPINQLINQLGIQKASYIREDFYASDDLESDETTKDSMIEMNLSEYYSVSGNFELYSVIWKPVVGYYEIQQIDDTFHGKVKILIQRGLIEIKNKFVKKKDSSYTNALKINTPFFEYRTLTSNYKYKIPSKEKGFTARLDFGILNKIKWSHYGFKLNYLTPHHPEYKIHDITLIILYPLLDTSRIILNSRLELVQTSLHYAKLSLDGFKTYFELAGEINEIGRNFDSSFNLLLKSPVIEFFEFQTYLKKTTIMSTNKITGGFVVKENEDENNFHSVLSWRKDNKHIIDGDLYISSNVFPIQVFNSSLYISEGNEPSFDIKILFGESKLFLEEIRFYILKKDLQFEGELITPAKEFSSVRFNGFLVEQGQVGTFKATGNVFKNTVPYNFDGIVTAIESMPTQIDFKVNDFKGGDSHFTYDFKFEDLKRAIRVQLERGSEYMSFESELYIKNIFDWAYNIKILSSRPQFNELKLSTTLTPITINQLESSFVMMTPWRNYMIDKVNVSTFINWNPNDGALSLNYEISKFHGTGGCSWKLLKRLAKQDYQLKIFALSKLSDRGFITEMKYINSSKTPTEAMFMTDVNSLWKISTAAKFDIRDVGDMSLIYDLSLPLPVQNNHKITAIYKGSDFPPSFNKDSSTKIDLEYENEASVARLKTEGMITQSNINNSLLLEYGAKTDPQKFGSEFNVEKIDEKVEVGWIIVTPLYVNESTLNLKANYSAADIYRIVRATIHSPESNRLADANVAFADLTNAKGSINCSLPIFNLTWFDLNFDFDSQNEETGRFIKATWPENYAMLDSKSSFSDSKVHKEWKGNIKAELPLQSKHHIQIIYGLEEKALITAGDASVEYNTRNILNSHYTCKTEKTGDDRTKDVINLSLENELRPIGVNFISEKNKLGEKSEFNKRHLEVFDLSKDNRFNITGEFIVEIMDTQQKYKLVAMHPNRTIVWTSDYNSAETYTNQSAKIELAKNIWLGYNIDIQNHKTNDDESQELKLKISYPTRDVVIGGMYSLKPDSFDTDVNINWLKKELASEDVHDETDYEDGNEDPVEINQPKSISGKFHWEDVEHEDVSKDHQIIMVGLSHPSFEKNVTMKGSYYRDDIDLAKIAIEFDYSVDSDHFAKFTTTLKNLTDECGYKNYSLQVFGSHVATDFILNFESSMGIMPNNYKIEAIGNYKRSYLPDMALDLVSFIDAASKKFKFYRLTPNQQIDIYGAMTADFPRYTIDSNYIDEPDYDTTGVIELNLANKHFFVDVNFTSDASQNLQVLGIIPDSRSATFNVWRNYDDIRINDISYFIQMNHSRLITSKMLWRPKMRRELKESFKGFIVSRYNTVYDEMDYWIKTFYSEFQDTVKGIWEEASPYTKEFFEDVSSMKDIDEDLSALRNFLNASFYADDFYIQSFVNYTLTVFDELSITDHIQTIPKFFKEMWEVLGESGMAFKKSALWIIETVKGSYKESIDIFNQLMHGNSLEHLTHFFESLIERYDRFVKGLHVSFIRHVESMWDNLIETFSLYWNRILQNIEPQFIRSIHYVESTLWSVSNEIFDFLYNRTSELVESPYFSKVSDITHDIDILVQDLQNNDAFSNFRKYSALTWQFLKEKFMKIVPFGKEMKELAADISVEFKELQNIDTIRQAIEKYEDLEAKVVWILNEFQFEKRLNMMMDIIRRKLMRITQNALETDDIYREAKTKFIFDPDIGNIEWEQKLPMSWHAFNETPHYDEIPEYKLLNDIQTFLFSKKNSSIWNIYYELKPLSEPQNFLPPFKANALLVGSRHVITYDQNFVKLDAREYGELTEKLLLLDERCSHLLAHDFVENLFSIILKPSITTENKKFFLSKTIAIQSGSDAIEIELGNPSGIIKIGDNLTSFLPTLYGDTLITRDFNVVTVSSKKGFTVKCNLEFDVCSIELIGWYFGKIAGVLGTMNNEKFDDLTKSDNLIAKTSDEFINSWKLSRSCSRLKTKTIKERTNLVISLQKTCSLFFQQKTSYFSSCFSIVDPVSFHEMCLSLGTSPRHYLTNESMEKAACISAVAYIESCAIQNVPLRVPDTCVHCQLPNGTFITEGTFVELKDEAMIVPSIDVVFLMEASECNVNQAKKQTLSTLVSALSNELKQMSINSENQRYAIVTFGGANEFSQPKTVTSNGEAFTLAQNIQSYFDHVKSGNGSTDVSTAITAATQLIFKPGAIKIFILSICSKCEFNLLKFDFKSVSQHLRENEIAMHVLSDDQFNVKKILGIDRTRAYTRKDQTKLIGDEGLRRQITLSKELGQCTSLALDTDGSIFAAKSNAKKNDSDLKVVANVFAKRIASSVRSKTCQLCECQGLNSGTAYMTCMACDFDLDDEIDKSYEDDQEL